jgi:hypothetical protein
METIKSLLAKKLLLLSESTSVSEKEEAMSVLGISRPTLDKYLSGDMDKIAKVDVATELNQFLSKKVKARMEKIRETNLV